MLTKVKKKKKSSDWLEHHHAIMWNTSMEASNKTFSVRRTKCKCRKPGVLIPYYWPSNMSVPETKEGGLKNLCLTGQGPEQPADRVDTALGKDIGLDDLQTSFEPFCVK